MDQYGKYIQVTNDQDSRVSQKYKYLRRQVFVSSAVWSSFFSYGILIGTTTVYIAQTRKKENSTGTISSEVASWVGSTSNYSAVPFLLAMAASSTCYGRKKSFLVSSFTSSLGFITLYLSHSVTHYLIGEFILGNLLACNFMIGAMVLTEFTTPKHRGLLLMLKSATFSWGILVANTMGLFFNWKYITLVGFSCTIYSFCVSFIWPESPYWLASQGEYEACSISHCWLKGNSEESVQELKAIIESNKDSLQLKKNVTLLNKILNALKILIRKEFWYPFSCLLLLACLYNFSGKMACSVFIIQIIKSVVNSDSTAYTGAIIIDALCVICMYFTSFITKSCKRKLILLIASLIGVSVLFVLSTYLYLVKMKIMIEIKHVFLFLLTVYMIAISCGPVILIPTITAELCPLKHRSVYLLLLDVVGSVIMASVIKITPFLFEWGDSHGAFLFYGISSLFLLIVIYFVIPETKDKTIVEMSYIMSR